MSAGLVAVERTSDSNWLGRIGRFLYVFFVLVVVFVSYKEFFDSGRFGNIAWWNLGTACLLLGGLVYILFLLNANHRRFGLFVFVNLLLTVLISSFLQDQIAGNRLVARAIQNNALLTFLLGGYFESVVFSLILGLAVALVLTVLPLLIISYAATVYVLALHEIEGVSRWDAMRYVITLILGINLPFMVVENGQALITKAASKLPVVGGPGELIIKHGNVVVLERAGKITRIVNAGVTNLKPLEKIRNVFVLSPQSNSAEIDHLLTKDRIPLKITLGIRFQIEPAVEADKRPESRIAPFGEALTTRLDDGLYQVYAGTIRKAALMSQATSPAKRHPEKYEEPGRQNVEETTWQKAAGSLPEGELRDHIMSHRFDELFELVDSLPGEQPALRVNKRKIYEIEQAIFEEIKPIRVSVLGVLVRGVDIGKIELPEGIEQLLLKNWWAPTVTSEAKARTAEWEAQAIVTEARAKAQAKILTGQGEAEARTAFFREFVREMKRERMLEDKEIIAALMRLIQTMVSFQDLETFVKAVTFMQRAAPSHPEHGGNGVDAPKNNGRGE